MGEYYIGQILPLAGTVTPSGFFPCDGRSLSVTTYQALYAVIGTQFGSNSQYTFSLPDLRGTVPIGVNPSYGSGSAASGISSYKQGQTAGSESVGLTNATMPAHTHSALCNPTAGNTSSPKNAAWAQGPNTGSKTAQYSTVTPDAQMAAGAVQTAGAGQAHPNIMPSTVINYVICYQGFFPPRA